MGGENVFFWEAIQAGYNVTNPCLSIKMYHHHCSDIRITRYVAMDCEVVCLLSLDLFSGLDTPFINIYGRNAFSGPSSYLEKRRKSGIA